MKKCMLILFALCVVLVIGCSNSITGSEETVEAEVLSGSLAKANPVVGMATGSGHVQRGFPEPEGQWRTFSVTARKYADGSCDGRFQVNNHGNLAQAKGKVLYVSFHRNTAWIAGIITHSSNPANVGSLKGFLVQDNYEGAFEHPDRVSLLHPIVEMGYATPEDFCNDHPINLVIHDVQSGNIQVKH